MSCGKDLNGLLVKDVSGLLVKDVNGLLVKELSGLLVKDVIGLLVKDLKDLLVKDLQNTKNFFNQETSTRLQIFCSRKKELDHFHPKNSSCLNYKLT